MRSYEMIKVSEEELVLALVKRMRGSLRSRINRAIAIALDQDWDDDGHITADQFCTAIKGVTHG